MKFRMIMLVLMLTAFLVLVNCGDDSPSGVDTDPPQASILSAVHSTGKDVDSDHGTETETPLGEPDEGPRVVLAWTRCSSDDFKSYTLYRSFSETILSDTTAATKLTEVTDAAQLGFTDSTICADTTYYYALKTTDENELIAWSNEVSIVIPGDITVIDPDGATVWRQGQTNTTVTWTGAVTTVVRIEIWLNDTKVSDYSDWINNTGSYTRSDDIPENWGIGSTYRIKVIDALNNSGFSEEFAINPIQMITVTEPNGSSFWVQGQGNTTVQWTGSNADRVRMELWLQDTKVDDYCGWVDNTGSYTRADTIPDSWKKDSSYHIKVIDSLDEWGNSEEFSICARFPKNIEFVTIPAGSFEMGAPKGEQGSLDSERPVHTVTFEKSFEMMTTEVTQGLWLEVMGSNPASFTGLDHPVETVSWDDCQNFVDAMNALDPTHSYGLPSESEWEYCCRAGTVTRFYWGDDPNETQIDSYAWWQGNSGAKTHPVAKKLPNDWGLFDMTGNVCEWIQDWFHYDYIGAPNDGSPWMDPSATYGIIRGGAWNRSVDDCRSASRVGAMQEVATMHYGFRIVRHSR